MKTRLGTLLALGISLVSVVASADDAFAKRRSEARSRFDRAIALSDEGDLDRALAEFQRAYDLVPSAVVLLNIALTQSALGRSAAGLESLDKLLADPAGLSGEEIATAKSLRQREAAKVGDLDVTTKPPGARIEIDNIAIATTPLERPLRVSSGQRIVGAVLSGYVPVRRTVTMAGGATERLELELVPLESRLAHLAVKTSLPGATLVANREVVAKTPITTTLTFSPGKYHLELTREGYVTAAADVVLGEGATGEVRLEPQVDEAALRNGAGVLALTPSEESTSVTIDGRALGSVTSVRLPAGPHAIVVEQAGFLPYERSIVMTAGKTLKLAPYLSPTVDTRDAWVSSANRTRRWGWYLIVGGGVIAATGTVLGIVFSGQRSDAQTEYDAVVARSTARGPGTCDDVCLAEFDAADEKLKSAKVRQTVAFVGLGVGAATAIVGGVLLGIANDPTRYDHPPKSAQPKKQRWLPAVTPLAGGAYASVVTSF